MSEQTLAPRIVVSADVVHGKPRIAGTRIMVATILDALASDLTVVDILSEDFFPNLTREDVLACVAYASRVVQNDEFVPVA
jgi:uncharacterized protein (DUF433 family)